jgi:hypothetical protein
LIYRESLEIIIHIRIFRMKRRLNILLGDQPTLAFTTHLWLNFNHLVLCSRKVQHLCFGGLLLIKDSPESTWRHCSPFLPDSLKYLFSLVNLVKLNVILLLILNATSSKSYNLATDLNFYSKLGFTFPSLSSHLKLLWVPISR